LRSFILIYQGIPKFFPQGFQRINNGDNHDEHWSFQKIIDQGGVLRIF
jgi:hypothetical protein